MLFLSITVFVLVLQSGVFAARLPARFQKCNRNQADLKQCIFKAARDGVLQLEQPLEELKLPSINPFIVPEASVGAGQGSVAVEQKFHDCKLYGFHKLEVKQFEFDFDKKTLSFGCVIPELNIQCQYELDGQILLLPVKGSGPSTVILKNVEANVEFRYKEIKKKGKTFIEFVSSDLTLNPGLITFNFENLFNGDKTLGDNINKVLNDNWKEVFAEVQDGYVEIVKTIIIQVFNKFFAKVSLEEALD